jgi:putative flippase GtrA
MHELPKTVLSHRVSKFLTSGGVAAFSEYAAFGLLTLLAVPLVAANSFSFMAGLVVSYNLNRRWVFASEGGRKRFGMYFALAGVNLLLSNVIVFTVHEGVGVSGFIAKLAAMAFIATNNYFIYARFIFKN